MKILLIDVNCKASSTGEIVYNLYNYLRKNGHQAAICYGRGPNIKENCIFKFGLDLETYAHAALSRLTGLNGYFSYKSTRRLIKFIENYKPEIVHIHELHGYFVNLYRVVNYLKSKNIPIVWTFHCEYMYTGKCGHAYDCKRFIDQCGHCPYLHDYPSSFFIDATKYMLKQKKRCLENYERLLIISPSNWLAKRVRMSFLKEKKLRVIHNGINVDTWYSRNDQFLANEILFPKNHKIVLSIAPNILSEQKGGKWVLRLARIMEKDDILFILVGALTKKNASVTNYEANVLVFPITKDQNRLAKFYSIADLFLICSKRENYPTTCIEAQCCGTPIAGFNEGGSMETDLDSGRYFVDYGDLIELSIMVRKALSEESPRKREQRSQLAHQQFTYNKMGEEYVRAYRDML